MEIVSLTSILIAVLGAVFSIFAFFMGSRIKSNERLKNILTYAIGAGVIAFVILSGANYFLINSGTGAPGNVTVTKSITEKTVEQPQESTIIKTKRSVAVTLSEHGSFLGKTTKNYTKEYKATDGFLIKDAKFIQRSATRVSDFNVDIINGGCLVVIQLSLTSGPKVDRYKGWLNGELHLTEQEISKNPIQPMTCGDR